METWDRHTRREASDCMQSCIQCDKQEGDTPSEITFALSEKLIEFSIPVLYDVILRHSLTQLISQKTVNYAK